MWAAREQVRAAIVLIAAATIIGLIAGTVIASGAQGDFYRFRVFVVRSIVYGSVTLALCISGLGFVIRQRAGVDAPEESP